MTDINTAWLPSRSQRNVNEESITRKDWKWTIKLGNSVIGLETLMTSLKKTAPLIITRRLD